MNVVQRMGPMTVPRTAVAPLDRQACATIADAGTVRRAFRTWIDPLADADTADDLSLAVYEALANVVDHAYTERPRSLGPGTMTLWARASRPLLTGREVVVTVLDQGTWRPITDDPGWRGRGLPLMRRLTHATAVVSDGEGTVVQMRRRVAPVDADLLSV